MGRIGGLLTVAALMLAIWTAGSAQEEARLDITLDYVSPQTNLFFIDPGFLDVSCANGIAGALVNPASLASVGVGELGIAGGLSRSASFPFQVDLIEEGESEELPDGLSIPLTLKLVDKGGLDYVGGAFRLGPIVIGGTVIRGESYGMDPSLGGRVAQRFHYVVEDTLTNDDFPEIPESDTIPVTWDIDGLGSFDLAGSGSGRASITPGFLGAGVGLGPLKVGMGVNIIRYAGDVDLLVRVNGGGSGLLGRIDTTSSGWRINADVNGVLEEDTLVIDSFKGEISGNQVALLFGILGDFGFLDLGFGLEGGFPFELRGDYENSVQYATGVPQGIEIDTSGVDVDSIAQRISGSVIVRFSDLEMDERGDSDQGTFKFGSRLGTRVGVGLDVFRLRLGVAGGVDLFEPGESNVGVYHVSGTGALELKPVTLRAGLVTRWQYLQFEEVTAPLPPATSFGLTTSVDVSPVVVDLALRMNLLTAMLAAMESLETEEIRPLSSLNLGMGVRYRF